MVILESLKEMLNGQYGGALDMLGLCIDGCPETAWDEPVANHRFCQLAFHTLFFADYYLEPTDQTVREQDFHRQHPEIFRDYEELQDRRPTLRYEKKDVQSYLEHCRHKAGEVTSGETTESLAAPCQFARREFRRLELHVYNIRHIQHHAGQLSLRLRLDHEIAIPWVGTKRG